MRTDIPQYFLLFRLLWNAKFQKVFCFSSSFIICWIFPVVIIKLSFVAQCIFLVHFCSGINVQCQHFSLKSPLKIYDFKHFVKFSLSHLTNIEFPKTLLYFFSILSENCSLIFIGYESKIQQMHPSYVFSGE